MPSRLKNSGRCRHLTSTCCPYQDVNLATFAVIRIWPLSRERQSFQIWLRTLSCEAVVQSPPAIARDRRALHRRLGRLRSAKTLRLNWIFATAIAA
jgi:hypothetical protein